MQLDLLVIRNFAIALFIGALVGIEREKKKEQLRSAIGGLRTFILIAEGGAVSAWLSAQLGVHWIFVGGAISIAGIVLAGYFGQRAVAPEAVGITTEVAAMVTYLLGGMTLYGFPEIAVALAIVTSALLAFKESLHDVVGKLGQDDLVAGLKLLIATFIVLPLLPNRTIDPWEALNPYKLWWLVILISALSLVGYVAVRWLGDQRGTALTGLFGGMVSSTAVSLSFARRSRTEPSEMLNALLTGILLSWVVMCVRIVIEVAITDPALTVPVTIPMTAMAIASAALAGGFYMRSRDTSTTSRQPDVRLKNPFSLTSAIQFGAFYALVLLVVQFVRTEVSGNALYVVSALAGATQVDAITLSMADYAKSGGPASTAVGCITVGAISNTVVKCGIIWALGARTLLLRMAIAGAAVVVVTVAGLLVWQYSVT